MLSILVEIRINWICIISYMAVRIESSRKYRFVLTFAVLALSHVSVAQKGDLHLDTVAAVAIEGVWHGWVSQWFPAFAAESARCIHPLILLWVVVLSVCAGGLLPVRESIGKGETHLLIFFLKHPVDVQSFYDESIAAMYENDRQTEMLMNSAMDITILISCIGLFGLAMFEAERKTREIGIRKVFGATAVEIVLLLSRDFVGLVAIAIVIASPIAYWFMNRWLDNFAYRVLIDWQVFALAGLSAVAITLVTVSYQSIKAAIANPVHSLRVE